MQLWKEVSGQLFFAVLTFQLVMLGLLGLKASTCPTCCCFPQYPPTTMPLW